MNSIADEACRDRHKSSHHSSRKKLILFVNLALTEENQQLMPDAVANKIDI